MRSWLQKCKHQRKTPNQSFRAKTKVSQKLAGPRNARTEEVPDHLAKSIKDFGDGTTSSLGT